MKIGTRTDMRRMAGRSAVAEGPRDTHQANEAGNMTIGTCRDVATLKHKEVGMTREHPEGEGWKGEAQTLKARDPLPPSSISGQRDYSLAA